MKSHGQSPRVLILEDSENDTLLIVDELRRGGLAPIYKRVDTRASYLAEISKDWEIILADYSLPKYSGKDALIALNESGRDIPLIIISGSLNEESAVSLLKTGAKDFVTKSNLSRLTPAVRRELDEFHVREGEKKLKRELQERKKLENAFFNSASEAFMLLDKDLRFVKVNPNLERRVGKTDSELRGRLLTDEFPAIKISGRYKKYLKVLETGEPVELLNEKTYPPQLGERVANIYAFKVGGGLGLIINDITEISQYEKRLEALHEHATKIAKAETLEGISEASLEVMASIFNFEFMSFLVVQEAHLVGVGSRGVPLAGFKLSLDGKGITVKAARTQKTIRIDDLRTDADFIRGSTDSLSELAVPVVIDGETVAVLNAESPRNAAFSQQDERLLEILSSHVASAIHRIRSREELTNAEMLTQIIINEVPDGIYITDLENRIIDVNQAIPRTLGYTRSELIGMNSGELESPKFRAKFAKLRENLLKTGRNLFESEAIAKNGEVIPIEVSTRLISYKGKPTVIGVSRDLRARKKTEIELRESEELYRTILENSPNPVSITVNGEVVYVNPSRLKLGGVSSFKEVEGKKGIDYIHPDDLKILRERNIIGLKDKDGAQSYEIRVRKSDGTYAQVEAVSTPLKFKGREAVLHVLHDVTQRRDYEKRLASLHDYARNLAMSTTMADAGKVVGDAVQGILETSFGSVAVVAGDSLKFLHVYGVDWGTSDEMPLNGSGVTVRAARTGETQLVADVSKDPDYFIVERQTQPSRSEIAVPISIDGKVVAVINVENTRVNAFDWSDVKIVEMLGNHFSSAIQRIRYVEELKYEEVQMATLHDFTNRLAEANTFLDAGTIAADSLKTLLNTTSGSLSFVEDNMLRHRYVFGIDLADEFVQPLDGPGISVRAANSGEPQLVRDVRDDADYRFPEGVEIVTRSELAVPVKVEGRVVAVVNAESPNVGAFTLRDQRVLEILAMHLGSTYTRLRDNQSKERYKVRLEAMNMQSAKLDSAQSPTEVALIASDMIKSISPVVHVRINLLKGEELVGIMIPGVHQTIPRLNLKGKGITVRAVKTRKTVFVEDVESDPDYMKGSPDTFSELAIPLIVGERLIGVMDIESPQRDAFQPDDRKLAETLALHVSSTLERLRLDSERLEALIVLRRKEFEAEQAKDLEKMKTRFISTATHEIRTPLTSIKGYTELIQGELEAERIDITKRIDTAKKYFAVVGRNVDRLVQLTDDLLDTQRIEEGRMPLNLTMFDVSTFLKDLAADITPLLSKRRQTLSTSRNGGGEIKADKSRLMQVLVNLISNSSKFSPEGSVIYVTMKRLDDEVVFSVRDNGVGLNPEDMPKLFKPFPGIHVEGNPDGTGLGLSICKGIVEMHGGRIWAESKGRGKGTKFSFTIPEAER